MALSRELANLLQADQDTNVRIDDLEIYTEGLDEAKVVKRTDEDYKNGENYLIDALVLDDPNVGSEIKTVRADFFNADSKLQIGMKQLGNIEKKPIKKVIFHTNYYESFNVYICHFCGIVKTGTYISGYGSEAPDPMPRPFNTNETVENGSWYTETMIRIPMDVEITLTPKTDDYINSPIIYSDNSLNSTKHVGPGLVSMVDFVDTAYYYPGYYSNGRYIGETFEKDGVQYPKTVRGDVNLPLYFDDTNWDVSIKKTPDLTKIEYFKNDKAGVPEASYREDIETWYDSEYEVTTTWRVTTQRGTDSEISNVNVNIEDYISWDDENQEFVLNNDNTVLFGNSPSGHPVDSPTNYLIESRVVANFYFSGTSYPSNLLNGSTRHSVSNTIKQYLTNVPGDRWAPSTWIELSPYNYEIYEYSQSDKQQLHIPFKENINLTSIINDVDCDIYYDDDTNEIVNLPIFYLLNRYNTFFEVYYTGTDTYDRYNTGYTHTEYLKYIDWLNGDYKEKANPYETRLGSNNKSYDNDYNLKDDLNHGYLGDSNYIFGTPKKNKIIGNNNFIQTDKDGVILIGNDNINYSDIFENNDIVVSNDLNGIVIRGIELFLLIDGILIPFEGKRYKIVRDSEDESYINLIDEDTDDILSSVYAPYELTYDSGGIALGDSIVPFPTDLQIDDIFDDSAESLFIPVNYNNLKEFYMKMIEKIESLDFGTTYSFSSDSTGLFIEDDNTHVKQYVNWGTFTEDEFIDIFNNTPRYTAAEEVLW